MKPTLGVSVEELRKSYESLKSESPSPVRARTPAAVVQRPGSVQDMRRSLERLAVASPTRSVTFELGENTVRLRSSSEETRRSGEDRVTSAKSSSNPDLLSTLVAESRRRVATRRLRHRSASGGSASGGSASDLRRPPGDPTKYSRAYLAMIKSGEVVAKRNKIEGTSGQELPEANHEFISKHLTDLSRPVIKTQEIADVGGLRKRLQEKARAAPRAPMQREKTPPGRRMKHVSRSVGHSKILGRMLELKQDEVDEGTLKLFERARDEDEYLKVFRSGEVGSKVSRFEGMASTAAEVEQGRDSRNLDLDPPGAQPDSSAFSWTRRFMEEVPDLPKYNAAQRHVQFANYFGYAPSESATKNSAGGERAARADTLPAGGGGAAAARGRRPRSSDWLDAKRRVFQRAQEAGAGDHQAAAELDANAGEDPPGQPMSLPPGT